MPVIPTTESISKQFSVNTDGAKVPQSILVSFFIIASLKR